MLALFHECGAEGGGHRNLSSSGGEDAGCVNPIWHTINYIIDSLFLIDIILQFNVAQYDDNLKLITERGEITYNYLTGFFVIDVVSILHLEWFIPGAGDATNLLRFLRLGRLVKVVKMLKVARLIKLS